MSASFPIDRSRTGTRREPIFPSWTPPRERPGAATDARVVLARMPFPCHPARMDPLYVALVAVALSVVAVLLWRVLGRRPPARPRLPYTKRASLLTPAE